MAEILKGYSIAVINVDFVLDLSSAATAETSQIATGRIHVQQDSRVTGDSRSSPRTAGLECGR
jgi:hypothetical protein